MKIYLDGNRISREKLTDILGKEKADFIIENAQWNDEEYENVRHTYDYDSFAGQIMIDIT